MQPKETAVLFLSYLFHSLGNRVQISSRMLDTLSKEGLLVRNRWMYEDGSSRHLISDTIVAGTYLKRLRKATKGLS